METKVICGLNDEQDNDLEKEIFESMEPLQCIYLWQFKQTEILATRLNFLGATTGHDT